MGSLRCTIQNTIAHVIPASEGQTSSRTSKQGIAAYEIALTAHLEAIRTIRGALSGLANVLSDAQTHRLKMETATLHWRCRPTA